MLNEEFQENGPSTTLDTSIALHQDHPRLSQNNQALIKLPLHVGIQLYNERKHERAQLHV